MNVEIAKSAGFCFGVSRAVNLVYEQTEHAEGPVYTIGPIIHNEQVVDDLYRKGVRILDEDLLTEDGLSPEASSTVIIRSHGVTKAVYEKYVFTADSNTIKEIPKDGKWINDKITLTDINHFGGWKDARAKHFADGAYFDQIYEQ